ncbi:MAG: FG-GAP repeat domain-containing protein [Myxococcota bacterium]
MADVDGDGTDELYVSFEGHVGEAKELVHPVEIRRYDADTPADAGFPVATLEDRLSRFLTAGDVDGDGKQELVAATYSAGLWLLRPGEDPRSEWKAELIDKKSGGFEHASILADLDGDGSDELYVASDRHKEVRRYVWVDGKAQRTVIYKRPDDRPIFTWNLMPIPRDLIPGA